MQRVVDPLHFDGVVGAGPQAPAQITPLSDTIAASELRPLLEYERLVGGRW